MAKRKDKKRREKKREREVITLEMKVRALKLFKIDNYTAEDVLTDLETTCQLRVISSAWNNPEQFLQQIEEEILSLIGKEGIYTQHLQKLLVQAGLISLIGGNNE